MSAGLSDIYKVRFKNILVPLVEPLEKFIKDCLRGEKRIDRISVRAKNIESFLAKAQKFEGDGNNKYSDPINQIQDQLGARIVTFYMDDVDRITNAVEQYFRPIEKQHIVPDSEKEFGYFGQHFVLLIPPDILDDSLSRGEIPDFFEMQIKTLYQHAWAEANHDLGYKANMSLSTDEKRKIAFTAAQSWGADMIFNELHKNSVQSN